MSKTGDIIRGAGGQLKRNTDLGVGIGHPHGGEEGDIRVQMVDGSPKLYAKAGGRWYGVGLKDEITEELKIGTTSNYIKLDPNVGINIVNDSTDVASIGTTLRVGRDSTGASALRVESDGSMSIGIKDGTPQFAVAANGDITFGGELSTAVDLSGLTEAAVAAGDYFVFFDGGITGATRKDNIDDLATLFAGTGLTASSSSLSVDVSDFMSNGSDNRVITATGADAMNAESSLVFDGTSLGIGTTSPDEILEVSKSGGQAKIGITSYSDTATNQSEIVFRKADGTEGFEALIDDNDVIGQIKFQGYTDAFRTGAVIEGKASGTPASGTDMPTDLNFYTAADGEVADVTATPQMTILSTGYVGIGTATPDKTLFVKGDIVSNPSADSGVAGANLLTNDGGDALIIGYQNDGATIGYRIDADGNNSYFNGGNVGIGTAAPDFKFEVEGSANDTTRVLSIKNTATGGSTSGGVLQLFQHDGAAAASGDRVGLISFLLGEATDSDKDADTAKVAGSIQVFAETGWSTSENGAYMNFSTNDADDAIAERLRITSDGNTEPGANYSYKLGSITKKWLSLHAAELRVDTLVAADVLSTIGGRIIVAPTTELVADLADVGGTVATKTMYVKHNNIASGDIVYMQKAGQFEAIKATGGAGTQGDEGTGTSNTSGNYSYQVTRGFGTTTADAWVKGDALCNTGTTGDGFIDLYADHGINVANSYGPTIVGNVRTGTGVGDYEPMWAIGNLRNLYHQGTGSDIMSGVGIGLKGSEHLLIKENSIQFKDNTALKMEMNGDGDIKMYADDGSAVMAQWEDTTLTLGGATDATDDCVVMSAGNGVFIYEDSANYAKVNADGLTVHEGGNDVAVFAATTTIGPSTDRVTISSSGITLRENNTDQLTMASNVITVGSSTDKVTINGTSGITIRENNVDSMTLTDGVITVGSSTDKVTINGTSGITIKENNADVIQLVNGVITVGSSTDQVEINGTSGITIRENNVDTIILNDGAITLQTGTSQHEKLVLGDASIAMYSANAKLVDITDGKISIGPSADASVTDGAVIGNIHLASGGAFIYGDNINTFAQMSSAGLEVTEDNVKKAIFGAISVIGSDGGAVSPTSENDCIRIEKGTVSIFESANNKATINSSGLTCYQDGADVANFGSTMRVGVSASDKTAFRIAADGTASIGTSAVQKIRMDSNGDLTVDDIKLTGKIDIIGDGLRNVCIGTGQTDAGEDNISIGVDTGTRLGDHISSKNNVFIGTEAGKSSSYGSNTLVGAYSGAKISTGSSNTAFGHLALTDITSSGFNTAIGKSALENTTSASGTAVGHQAGLNSEGGNRNVFIGKEADVVSAQFGGDVDITQVICMGYQARASGDYGIAIGSNITAAANTFVFGKLNNYATSTTFDTSGSCTFAFPSDERRKTDIKDAVIGLDFINELRPRTFNWKPAEEFPEEWHAWEDLKDEDGNLTGEKEYHEIDTETTMHGFIAQEGKAVLDKYGVTDSTDVWNEDEKGIQRFDELQLMAPLIKAVQELSAKVTALEAKGN